MAERPKTVFVREAGGVGDIVCCTAAVDAYAEAHPDREAWFLTLDVFRPLALFGLRRPNARLLGLPARARRCEMHQPVRERLAVYQEATREAMEFDEAVDFWCPADAHERATHGRPTLSRLDCFFRAAGLSQTRAPKFEIPEGLTRAAEEFWTALDRRPPHVLIFPTTAHASKDWPMDRWQAVADAIGREHCLTPALRAGSKRRPKLDGVPMAMGLGHGLLAGLIAGADLVLCGDSGPMHLAAAVETPCLALFGPTNGEQMTRDYPFVAPLMQPPPLVNGAPGCFWPCLRYLEQGYARCRDVGVSACLEEISVEEVVRRVRAILGADRKRSVGAPARA